MNSENHDEESSDEESEEVSTEQADDAVELGPNTVSKASSGFLWGEWVFSFLFLIEFGLLFQDMLLRMAMNGDAVILDQCLDAKCIFQTPIS